ncbi:hypothetical protein TNCV_3816651 [Trichonephila clavipes]|nr:hypothetical protein TNCV_3816651 [Trichonephila clavipes]
MSFESPGRIKRKHILATEVKMFKKDGRRRKPEVILSMGEFNLDPQDINEEKFQLECVRLQAFVAATDPGSKLIANRLFSVMGRLLIAVVVAANATCLTQSERDLRVSSWQGARSTPVVGLGLGLHTEEIPCTRDSAHKTFGPTDLMSTFSVCTRRVFGGLGHRTQVFRSGVRCPNH